MLKAILTQMLVDRAFLLAALVSTGHIDANASPERIEAVVAEMRDELASAGITEPVEPEPAPPPVTADEAKV